MLAEDGGDGAGGSSGGDGDGAGEGAGDGKGAEANVKGKAKNEPFDPSTKLDTRTRALYESQLPPKFQKDDFKGIEDIGKLYEGYRTLERDSKGALRIPTAESTPEEIKGFFTKIGMPEEKEGYACPKYDGMNDVLYEPMRDLFRESAFRCGLTKGQAEKMWMNVAASVSGLEGMAKNEMETLRKTVDARYDDMLKDEIPDETRRKERIEMDRNIASAFEQSSGLGEFFEKTGLHLLPEFTHKLAAWYQKMAPMTAFQTSGGNVPPSREKKLEDTYSTMF